MNKLFNGALCAGLFTLGLAVSVEAAPISSNSIIEAVQFGEFTSSDFVVTRSNGVNLSSPLTSSNGSTLDAKANIALGTVGSSVFSTDDANGFGANGQSRISIFDTLSFSGLSGPTAINYDLSLDGTLLASSIFDSPFERTAVRIYDITGLTNWLEETSFLGLGMDIGAVSAATKISQTSIFEEASVLGLGLHVINKSASGSFIAEAGKTYGISLSSNSFSSGQGSHSDFLNTSTFSFTNLNGASFNSGSGAFLSAATTAIPEPSMLALLGIGMLGFMRCTSRKQNSLTV